MRHKYDFRHRVYPLGRTTHMMGSISRLLFTPVVEKVCLKDLSVMYEEILKGTEKKEIFKKFQEKGMPVGSNVKTCYFYIK